MPHANVSGLRLNRQVECLAEPEIEFRAWYKLEHIPERLRIAGFLTGRRYATVEGVVTFTAG